MDLTGLISSLFWIILIGSTLLGPFFTQRRLETMRLTLMGRMQKKRGSRVITLIHRQEALSLLGIPLSKYIDIEDSEQVLRAIRMTPDAVSYTHLDIIKKPVLFSEDGS